MKLKQRGFTLVELLIATMVFSVVLLLCASGLIKIGKAFTKGVITTRTQESARNVIENISQTIQLNPGAFSGLRGPGPSNETHAYCVGNRQFSFILNKKVSTVSGPDEARHALMAHTTNPGGCPLGTAAGPVGSIDTNSAPGQELLGSNMQLANLTINQGADGRFEIIVRVIYGDDDLFLNANTPTATCKPQTGTEYCAISELRTIIQKRVE